MVPLFTPCHRPLSAPLICDLWVVVISTKIPARCLILRVFLQRSIYILINSHFYWLGSNPQKDSIPISHPFSPLEHLIPFCHDLLDSMATIFRSLSSWDNSPEVENSHHQEAPSFFFLCSLWVGGK